MFQNLQVEDVKVIQEKIICGTLKIEECAKLWKIKLKIETLMHTGGGIRSI